MVSIFAGPVLGTYQGALNNYILYYEAGGFIAVAADAVANISRPSTTRYYIVGSTTILAA